VKGQAAGCVEPYGAYYGKFKYGASFLLTAGCR